MRFEFERSVRAEPAVVFARATDFARASEVVSSIVACEVLTEGPIGVGTRIRETRRMFGREATEEMEITRFDEAARGYTLECRSNGCHYVSDVDVCEGPDGTSLFRMTFEATPLNLVAKIMAFLTRPLAKKMVEAIGRDIEEIGRACEKDAADAVELVA
jgi:hypothetical protein